MCSSTITTFVFVFLLWKSSAIDVNANDDSAGSENNSISLQNETTTSNTTRIRPLLFWTYNDEDIQYLLYTRENPNEFQELKTNDTASLFASHFDFKKKTKIIVHGWLSDGTSSVPEEIKNAYLNVTDDNIINVDWCKHANTLYSLARMYVPIVSKSLTDFLVFLVNNGLKTSELHLIGHSLGAHVVGIAGKYYYREKKPINIISALDPAKPLFEWSDKDNRLDKSDARHVEVIHTCGGMLGFPDPLGHLDFYPNGGRKQPGCGFDLIGSCAHNRAVQYFAESINFSVPFTAVKCEDYDEVYYNGRCNRHSKQLNMSGLHLDVGYKGIYYLKTKAEAPYALGSPDNWPDSSRNTTNLFSWLWSANIKQYNISVYRN